MGIWLAFIAYVTELSIFGRELQKCQRTRFPIKTWLNGSVKIPGLQVSILARERLSSSAQFSRMVSSSCFEAKPC